MEILGIEFDKNNKITLHCGRLGLSRTSYTINIKGELYVNRGWFWKERRRLGSLSGASVELEKKSPLPILWCTNCDIRLPGSREIHMRKVKCRYEELENLISVAEKLATDYEKAQRLLINANEKSKYTKQ